MATKKKHTFILHITSTDDNSTFNFDLLVRRGRKKNISESSLALLGGYRSLDDGLDKIKAKLSDYVGQFGTISCLNGFEL